ncbi:MAG: hypothetical protein ACFFDI_11685 [Promethearchaeota archaeon]
MDNVSTRKQVLAIRTPLRRKPIYIEIKDDTKSIEEVLKETITNLEAVGQNHEALSLEKMLVDHKIVFNGMEWDPALPVHSLTFKPQKI